MSTELWKATENPKYEISNHGRVKSFFGACGSSRILKCPTDSRGYRKFVMWRDGKPEKHRWVHQLVAEFFCGPRCLGQQVRHKNGNRLDNHASNLEYGTASENMQDAVKHRSLHMLKLDPAKVREIRRRWKNGERQIDLAREFGVRQTSISAAVTGAKWGYV